MRAVLALAAVSLGGCAQIVGDADPVTPFPIPPSVKTSWLLSIQGGGGRSSCTWQLKVDVNNIDFAARVLDLHLTPLASADQHELPNFDQHKQVDVDNDASLDFRIEPFDLSMPQMAGCPGTFAATLAGHFLNQDAFCGTISGALDSTAIDGTTFGATKIEGSLPPPHTSCASLGG